MTSHASDIKEVGYYDLFTPPQTVFSFSQDTFPIADVNPNLILSAMTDAKDKGLEIRLWKIFRHSSENQLYLTFEVVSHDDLFWVYVTDTSRKQLTLKFRFSPT